MNLRCAFGVLRVYKAFQILEVREVWKNQQEQRGRRSQEHVKVKERTKDTVLNDANSRKGEQ